MSKRTDKCPFCKSTKKPKELIHSHGWGLDKNFKKVNNIRPAGFGSTLYICSNCKVRYERIVQFWAKTKVIKK